MDSEHSHSDKYTNGDAHNVIAPLFGVTGDDIAYAVVVCRMADGRLAVGGLDDELVVPFLAQTLMIVAKAEEGRAARISREIAAVTVPDDISSLLGD